MIIKDRLIQVDIAEALVIAGKGEEVRCVGEGTGLMDIAGALEGLTFFAPESALAEKPEPIRIEASKDEIAKLENEIAKLGKSAPVMAHFDTPEARTRAILGSVERYDEEHGDPPVTRQDTEDAKDEAPKQEPPKQEPPKEEPAPVPFASAPSEGGVEEMTSGKIKINGHNKKPDPAEAPAVIEIDPRRLTIEWTDDMLGVLGAMRYTTNRDGERTTQWSINRLRSYFDATYDDIVHGLELYQMDEAKYNKAAEKFRLPAVNAGRAVWRKIKLKEENNK